MIVNHNSVVFLNAVESPLPINAKNTEITDQKLHKCRTILFSIRLKWKHLLHLLGMEHIGLGTSHWLRNYIPEQVSFLRQDPLIPPGPAGPPLQKMYCEVGRCQEGKMVRMCMSVLLTYQAIKERHGWSLQEATASL